MINIGDFVKVVDLYICGVVQRFGTLRLGKHDMAAAVLRRADGTEDVFLLVDLIKVGG